MSVLTVLIDTDVLLDFLIQRGPFTKYAKMIIQKTKEKKINAYLAAHSITNIFYCRVLPLGDLPRYSG
jgi:predicted nucleic acid-binding protein